MGVGHLGFHIQKANLFKPVWSALSDEHTVYVVLLGPRLLKLRLRVFRKAASSESLSQKTKTKCTCLRIRESRLEHTGFITRPEALNS